MMSKLVIGTANLCNKYGFLKKKLHIKEFKKVIEKSKVYKIKFLDTSVNYKGVHKILGKLKIKDIKIITKISIPSKKIINEKLWVKKTLEKILKDLKVKSVYGILIHNPSILKKKKYEKYFHHLQYFKKKKLFSKIGFSAYEEKEVKFLIKKFKFEILQLPINIINNTFCTKNFLKLVKKKNIKIYARSIFLQGILLSDNLLSLRYFKRWKSLWKNYYSWLQKKRLTKLEACLSFINNRNLSAHIIGFENMKQFEQIINCKIKKNIKFKNFLIKDKKFLVNPTKWK